MFSFFVHIKKVFVFIYSFANLAIKYTVSIWRNSLEGMIHLFTWYSFEYLFTKESIKG